MPPPVSDWITVTLPLNGNHLRVRCAAIYSYGTKSWGAFIEVPGKTIDVRESEAELAALHGDDGYPASAAPLADLTPDFRPSVSAADDVCPECNADFHTGKICPRKAGYMMIKCRLEREAHTSALMMEGLRGSGFTDLKKAGKRKRTPR
jgi:hypothetical protein